jgi:hypothetical protein
LDQGPDLVLASIPSITSIEQLKGKPIIVDSPVSGYAYLLQDVLSTYGLELAKGDYYFMVSPKQSNWIQIIRSVMTNRLFFFFAIDCRWNSPEILGPG